METYAFIHFGPNTFTDMEWGYGDAPLEKFNPTQLNCEQWAQTFVNAGMKGVIITAKHHDGFCLWPTKYTDYCVRNTPWLEGKGDVVGQLAEACRKYGLKFGVYLSPWDRHQAFYGTSLYPQYYRLQMEELLTQYGPFFEIWLDGANGGDGWYGGACEKRQIDRRTYYNFEGIFELVHKHQPQTIIFSDGGPGCRWVGNESGAVGTTNWSFLRIAEVYPGYDKAGELFTGHADGDTWVGAECDVSIRPGWFYHASEDEKVKTVDQLVEIYYKSVGHNGTMLLNFPVDNRGLIHSTDSLNAVLFHQRIQRELTDNLLLNKKQPATDGDFETYCVLERGSSIELRLPRAASLNRIQLQEYIPLGQRVKAFQVELYDGKQWNPLETEEETTTIGYKRILRFPTVRAKRLRLTILDSRAPVCLSEVAAFCAPAAL
jgi:alpha-L-fucosidase